MLTPIDTDLGERSVRSVLYAQKKPRSFQISLAVLAASFVLALCCASCGAVGSASPPSPAVTITVTPASARPYQGETWQFRAAVQNAANPAIEWQVNGINGGNSQYGTIDLNGLYTAPSAVPSPPTVTVSAALQSNTTKIGSASVTVLDLSSITGTLILSPEFSGATTTQTVQFNVLTPGVTDAEVKWSATGGTITSDGKYSSPGVPGPYTVIATLLANSNTAGSAIVEVTDFAGTLTWRNDNARSGINNRELALAPGNVNSPKFGKIFSCPIDGYAYAQPLYVPNLPIPGSGAHNVIFVATDKNSVFAFDADDKSCNQLWPGGPTTLGLSTVPNTNTNNFPVGIIGTPVISQGTDALYVVAATETFVTGSPVYSHRLYALDLATGHLVIQPAGVSIATPDSVFHSSVEKQRAALLTSNGTVYVAFGSTENPGDYHGWLLVYDAATLQPTGAFNSTQPPAVQGGIWQSGGGPSADSNGNVFVVTGDGPFNADRMPNSFSYGDSFLRLGAGASGALSVLDYFTPCDQQTLETKGLDVG
ncbi:MAG TPA: hypothetical protein VH161_08820, partial [Candidatus Acidoferrales bacterium]|nr:hypothetical protein [Candidatus Acidoferrales bacterium]